MMVYRCGNEFFPSEEVARKVIMERIEADVKEEIEFGEEYLADFKALTDIVEKIRATRNKTVHTFIFYWQCRRIDDKICVCQRSHSYTAIET